MAETPKLKKTGFWFFDPKSVNYQYFKKLKKLHTLRFIPLLYTSYNSLTTAYQIDSIVLRIPKR